MSVDRMKLIVRDAHDALMKGDVEKFVSLCSEDVTYIDPAGEFKGLDQIRRWSKWLYGWFPKLTFKETGLIVEENKLVHEYVFEGTTKDGLTARFPGVAIYEFKDEKIQQIRNFYDVLTIAKQVAKGVAKISVSSIDKTFRKDLL
ncbi:nuclear transport factor 2 family protein [Candidatus Bathyarchaeota archaeon]|nr:nuclear transport factor 2 family protein [Candidatus Bathyarchaeota archaeon]MBS7628559.1 nuclear transport factor 2 family protein [Candidatus Bathyarchaeota archaeon]